MTETETVRDTVTVQADGRMTIPGDVRKAVGIYGQKAFCQAENYGADKILLTIMNRWTPPKNKRNPGKDIITKESEVIRHG